MVEPSNPFVSYRDRLDSYAQALTRGWSDHQFVDLVGRLDRQVAEVAGHGFRVTPTTAQPALARALGLGGPLLVKDETGNVGGSHKSRHLFGVALHHAVAATAGEGELAIASCGNAALSAAVVARAIDRPLRVFIPTWADSAVVDELRGLGAIISVEERRPGEVGDPTYLRFLEAVAAGATPFSVQGTVTPATIDGGRTIGWELADQLAASGVRGPVRVFIQVGGGALAAACWRGLTEGLGSDRRIVPILHAVQTEACAPLPRAWDLLTRTEVAGHDWPERAAALAADVAARRRLTDRMRSDPDAYMFEWEPVGSSAASGILDDRTYDWMPIIEGMLASGGYPVVASEDQVNQAHLAAHATTAIDVEPTGTAGLAGMLAAGPPTASALVALFTGVTRHPGGGGEPTDPRSS